VLEVDIVVPDDGRRAGPTKEDILILEWKKEMLARNMLAGVWSMARDRRWVAAGMLARLTVAAIVGLLAVGCEGGPGVQPGEGEGGADDSITAEVIRVEASEPACAACRILLHPVAELGSHADAELLRRLPAQLVRDTRGQMFALVRLAHHEVLVYRPDGSQQGPLGELGEGPGEYRSPTALAVGPGDSIFLFHDAGRVSVFDPAGALARTFRTDVMWVSDMPHALDANTLVVPGRGPDSPREDGFPFHLLTADGDRRVEVQALSHGDVGRPEATKALRPFTDGSGGFWLASDLEYRIERYDSHGSLRRIVVADLPESMMGGASGRVDLDDTSFGEAIRENQRARVAHGEHQGPTLIQGMQAPLHPFELLGVQEIGEGQVLAVSRVLAEDWYQRLTEWERPTPVSLILSDENVHRVYRTMIDLLDVDTGELLVREILPGYGYILNDGSFAMATTAPDGLIQLRVYELEIDDGALGPTPD
jgi:hypothetical protein